MINIKISAGAYGSASSEAGAASAAGAPVINP